MFIMVWGVNSVFFGGPMDYSPNILRRNSYDNYWRLEDLVTILIKRFVSDGDDNDDDNDE